MNDLQKRAIARLAYKEVRSVMQKWESLGNTGNFLIDFRWDEVITVDDTTFYDYQLWEKIHD